MKNLAKICLLICILQISGIATVYATTFNWTGAAGTNWATPGNWKVGGTVQTINYPGMTPSTDVAQIGVANTFSNQPVISSAVSINTLTIGTQTAAALTVNAVLTVSGNITLNNNNLAGGITTSFTGSGSISCNNFYLGNSTQPPAPTLGLGLGDATYQTILNFSSLTLTVAQNLFLTTTSNTATIGNILLHLPSANVNNPVFNFNSGTITVGNALQTVDPNDANIDHYTLLLIDFASVSSSAQFLMSPSAGNISTLNLNGANALALDGQAGYIDLYGNNGGTTIVNYGGPGNQEVYTSTTPYSTSSRFSTASIGLDRSPAIYQNLIFQGGALTKKADGGNLTVAGNLTISPLTTETVDFATNSPIVTVGGNFVSNTGSILNQGGTGTLSISGTSNNAGTLNQTGSGNITFTGALNNSVASAVIAQTGTGAIIASAGISNTGTISQGSGTIGSITVTGNLTNTGTITQSTGNISTSADLSNSGTLTLGSANLTITGNYTNSGTYTQGTGTTVFDGPSAQSMQGGSGAGTKFNAVNFSGAGAKTMASGNFSVSSSGVLTMIGSSSLASNGFLTLNSDASGSAIVAALPTGAGITGNVNVQRFIKGSNSGTVHDLSKRGYRLLSATVFTGTDALGSHVSDLQYLTNSVYVSGIGGGFNVTTTTNPSIYLFREDDQPPPGNNTLFTTGFNWKGVAQINNTPLYNIGTQAKNTTSNINDTTVTIPVGNGMLFFFRGSNVPGGNGSTAGTQLLLPVNYPDDVTLTQTGTLNTGPVTVRMWFGTPALGNDLSYTTFFVNSTAILKGGFACVGNPYPSTINWEKFNNGSAPGAIIGSGGLPSKIWVFNVASKQYETYMPAQGTDITSERPAGSMITGTAASNFIASGQGFFVQASGTGQTLTFNETAKISKQPTAANMNNLMGKPKEFIAQPKALIRLKLMKDTVNADDILIALSKKADMKFVDNEDAQDMGGANALVSLSSFSSDKMRLAINSSPFPGLQQQVIALSADATASGTYTLASTQLDNLPVLYDVWLKDAFTNDSLKLKLNAAYQFTIDKNNPASFGNSRFTLLIRQNTAYAYQLLGFTANKLSTARQVQLVWKTSNEENYTNFTVERSTDGGNTFDIIGGLQGTGAGNYSLLDKLPVIGQNFYRLKQEDLNNAITYSKPVLIMYNGAGSRNGVNVYPNPAVSTIHVAIANNAGAHQSYNIRITNSSGTLVRQVTSVQANWQSSIAGLKPGTYIIKVHNNTDNSFVGDTKFVKL